MIVVTYPLFQSEMESTGNQVFIKEEIEEETKESLCDILSAEPIKVEDPLERWISVFCCSALAVFCLMIKWYLLVSHLNIFNKEFVFSFLILKFDS